MENKLLFIRPELTWFNKLGTAQPLALSHSSGIFFFLENSYYPWKLKKYPAEDKNNNNKDAIGVSLFSVA